MDPRKRMISAWVVRLCWHALLSALAVVCLSTPAFAFEQELKGTFRGKGIGREVSFRHHGAPRNDWAGTLKFRLDSGEDLLVFCIQIDVRVRSGDRYHNDGPVLSLPNGCKIHYLLGKYPASTAKDTDEAAARQMAIWVFSDGVDPTTIADAKLRARTIALVNEAMGKPCPTRRTTAPNLSVEPPTANADVGQVVAFRVRASPEDAGQSLTVSISGPAVFSDANGANSNQQQQNISLDGQSSAAFWVLSTGSGQSNISVVLPYRLEAGTVYSQIDNDKPSQRIVMAESKNLVANASAQVLWSAMAPSATPLVPSATPLPPSATPLAPSVTPPAATQPPPTHRPSRPARTEQPTEIVIAGEAVGATPTAATGEQATAIPPAAPAPVAGGAAPLPLELPRTGGPAGPAIWLIPVGAAVLFVGGWLLCRRGRLTGIS